MASPYRKRSANELIDTCAEVCFFAQDHSEDRKFWPARNSGELDELMEHTSHVISCLLAQNTRLGFKEGLESRIVSEELAGPVRTLAWWRRFFKKLVRELQ